MTSKTGQGPLKHAVSLSSRGQGTAAAVGDCHHAVNIGIVSKQGTFERVGNEAGHARRTTYRCQHPHIITCSNATVSANDALKRPLFLRSEEIDKTDIGSNSVVSSKTPYLQIMRMDMFAGCNDGGCKTYDLAELVDWRSDIDRAYGYLVS